MDEFLSHANQLHSEGSRPFSPVISANWHGLDECLMLHHVNITGRTTIRSTISHSFMLLLQGSDVISLSVNVSVISGWYRQKIIAFFKLVSHSI